MILVPLSLPLYFMHVSKILTWRLIVVPRKLIGVEVGVSGSSPSLVSAAYFVR
jgi:hypothetical protein